MIVTRAGRGGGGSIFPDGDVRPTGAATSLSRLEGRRLAAAVAPSFARLESADVAAAVADLKGDTECCICLRGDAGCATLDGDCGCGASLTGERGRVLELCDRGERTPIWLLAFLVLVAGFFCVFEAVRFGAGAVVVALW